MSAYGPRSIMAMKRESGPVLARLAGEAKRNATAMPRSCLVVVAQRFELNPDHVSRRESGVRHQGLRERVRAGGSVLLRQGGDSAQGQGESEK